MSQKKKKNQFSAKLQRVFETPDITFSIHFEGMCTFSDILHTHLTYIFPKKPFVFGE